MSSKKRLEQSCSICYIIGLLGHDLKTNPDNTKVRIAALSYINSLVMFWQKKALVD